jgi:signal transduction histidine kinase
MANYRLKKAIEELKDLNKMKSEFLALASHQIRSPLSASTWSLERLKELFEKSSSVSEENRKLLEEALERNKRMAKLIDNLLNISRIEAGRFLQKVEAVSLDDVVRGVIDIVPAPEEQRSIAVRYTSPKEKFIIMADTEKLALAIENIIDNAIKYSPPNATVDVAILRGTNNVAVHIKDQGMGIPKSEQEGVFGKFFRGQNAEKSQIAGSGLGLYLARKIIDGHGGSMSFESEEGKGTTFFIQLPLVEEEKEKGS